ncbi:MAG TPA: N-acetylneuraminate synthase [Luteibaculaceae bacterium]|nr:N-acetylneuraminate synthase [Luteibaculaceae bacterium]
MRVLIIAEAGVNHNGDMQMAKQLIDVAKQSGADIVKFQTAVPELVMTLNAPKAKYQMDLTGEQESQLEMAKKIHLPLSAFAELKRYAEQEVGIPFISTPFDEVSIDALHQIGMELYKIPSGEVTNLPYLRKIAGFRKPVILSTGMASLGEIEAAINVLMAAGLDKDQISILHCNTQYPTPFEDVNLRAMLTLKSAFGLKVGYSDHTLGIEVPVAAVAMGAEIIEKHFTLDKNLSGPDHKASLSPEELMNMVQSIRNIEQALGSAQKVASPSETPNKVVARRSIHLRRDMKTGEKITWEDLIMKRPGDGISPMQIELVVGKQIHADLPMDYKLTWSDFS